MRLSILIPPGFTKYQIAEDLSKEHGVPIISIKDLLLQEVNSGSDLGLDIKKQVDNSKPVSNENTISVVRQYFEENIHEDGFLLDGMPCNEIQASALDKILSKNRHKLQGVIFLSLNYDKLMELQTGRLVCRNCEADFNLYSNPPYIDKVCDECGSRLYHRSDDREETISRRIREFDTYLTSLEQHYLKSNLKIVKSDIDQNEVYKLTLRACKALLKNDKTVKIIASKSTKKTDKKTAKKQIFTK